MTKYDMNLPLPVADMDGEERNIMDGLWQDFTATMTNLAHLILADDAYEREVEYTHRENKDAPEYIIKKRINPSCGSVIFHVGFGYGEYVDICVDVERVIPREHIELICHHKLNGLSAIAKKFCELYRKTS